MVFIPKPGKTSYKIAKAWRPTSLTNYFIKALEKLCVWETDETLLKTQYIQGNTVSEVIETL